MCGRFTLTTKAESLAEWFQVGDLGPLTARYNIPPGGQILVVRQLPDQSDRELVPVRWGLIPSWAKDPEIGDRMANARAESAADKPSFRNSFRKRRCLIPADGFYEWKRLPGRKEPYYVALRDRQPFAFAGLWDCWRNAEGKPIESCTVLTTAANDLLRSVHDRMPVIIDPKNYAKWLDTQLQDPQLLQEILRPYPPEQMITHQVSRRVNNPHQDGPQCIEPAPEQAPPTPPPESDRLLF